MRSFREIARSRLAANLLAARFARHHPARGPAGDPHGPGRGSLFSVFAYWVRTGRRAAPFCSSALVAIANNGLKIGRYSAGSLSATMLFGKTLTKF